MEVHALMGYMGWVHVRVCNIRSYAQLNVFVSGADFTWCSCYVIAESSCRSTCATFESSSSSSSEPAACLRTSRRTGSLTGRGTVQTVSVTLSSFSVHYKLSASLYYVSIMTGWQMMWDGNGISMYSANA